MFFISTLIVQIVLLNMLIAIMNESFEQVIQQAHLSKLVERLNIINEFAYLFKSTDDE